MIYFLFLLTYLIGYLAGYFHGSKETRLSTIVDNMGKTIQKAQEAMKPKMKTGVIKVPTAKEIFDRHLPQSVKDGRQAMRETLDALPELQEAKNLGKSI